MKNKKNIIKLKLFSHNGPTIHHNVCVKMSCVCVCIYMVILKLQWYYKTTVANSIIQNYIPQYYGGIYLHPVLLWTRRDTYTICVLEWPRVNLAFCPTQQSTGGNPWSLMVFLYYFNTSTSKFELAKTQIQIFSNKRILLGKYLFFLL